MPKKRTVTRAAFRLPQIAATLCFCLLLDTSTHVTAANTLSPEKEILLSVSSKKATREANPAASPTTTNSLQVLTTKDEALYRAAFAAQAQGDWLGADKATAEIANKGLMGHLLADRYQHKKASFDELRYWLALYSDLPEAGQIYDQARHRPEAKTARLIAPKATSTWRGMVGGLGTDSQTGFKTAAPVKTSAAAKRFAGKINTMLRRGEPAKAAEALDQEMERGTLTSDDYANHASRIASGLFYDDQTHEARKLADRALYGRDPEQQNPLALWIAGLSAWKEGNPSAAGKFFVRLAAVPDLTQGDRAAVSFWAYRAMKQDGHTSLARHWLGQAAQQPQSFYGQLAQQLMGSGETKNWQTPKLNARTIAALTKRPAGWRALGLIQIGQTSLAENELQTLNPQNSHDLQEAMLAVAENQHMPSIAMKLGGLTADASGKEYDAASYPVPPWQPEQGFQMDRALMYALIRHESGFNPTAQSERGACGLMQLMPATAKGVAGNKSITGCSGRLLNPAYNMALGQKYVRQLAEQPGIGDNLLLILAAYNGGPGNALRWMDDEATRKDPLLFIESLPVRETRDYVQQVMIHYWNYSSRLSRPQTTLTQLARGEWPKAALHETAPTSSPTKQLRVMNGNIQVASQ